MKISVYSFFLIPLVLFAPGCAELQKHADAIKPTAKLTGTRLANIDFEKVELVFDLAVENRNPVALTLSGLDYDFRVENQSLVSGVASQGIHIKPNAISTIELPVSLRFNELKNLAGTLRGKDKVAYQLDTRINVLLPLIGNYPIPVSSSGELPVPKLPKIRLSTFKIKNLGFTSAEVLAQVEVDNPNAFPLGLSDLDYKLAVNQQAWGEGQIVQAGNIAADSTGIIEIPLKLNLLSMGQTAYRLLAEKGPLEYRLTGDMTIDTGLELLNRHVLPLDIKGTANLD